MQILIHCMRPEPLCAAVFSLQMFVTTTGKYLPRQTQRKLLFSLCNNNGRRAFIHEILSNVGEETVWQQASVCL